MKKAIVIIAGAVVCVIAAVMVVKQSIYVNQKGTSVSIIGGADGQHQFL